VGTYEKTLADRIERAGELGCKRPALYSPKYQEGKLPGVQIHDPA
jgi:hypothetical protein